MYMDDVSDHLDGVDFEQNHRAEAKQQSLQFYYWLEDH